MKLNKGASRLLIGIPVLLILAFVIASQAQPTVTKSYDSESKTVIISQGGSKFAEIQLISNTDNCLVDCEAIIRIKPTSDITLPSSANADYKWDFIKAIEDQAGLKSYWFEIRKTRKNTIIDYSLSCNPYDFTDGNGTLISVQNCTYIANGTHIESEFFYDPFDFWNQTLEEDKSHYVKLRGQKFASLGENNIEWIPTFYSLQLSEWASWNSSFGLKVPTDIQSAASNYASDVIIPIDRNTAALIDAGKLQADCDDYQFTNGSENIRIYDYLENGTCNRNITDIIWSMRRPKTTPWLIPGQYR
jgi:hypothetical protein